MRTLGLFQLNCLTTNEDIVWCIVLDGFRRDAVCRELSECLGTDRDEESVANGPVVLRVG